MTGGNREATSSTRNANGDDWTHVQRWPFPAGRSYFGVNQAGVAVILAAGFEPAREADRLWRPYAPEPTLMCGLDLTQCCAERTPRAGGADVLRVTLTRGCGMYGA